MKEINTKRPRKLDLNAPLLSTRRSNITSSISIELSRASSLRWSCDRVPFSWESSPGKPKRGEVLKEDNVLQEGQTVLPLPKPPLIRWQLEQGEPTTVNIQDDFEYRVHSNVRKIAFPLPKPLLIRWESEEGGPTTENVQDDFEYRVHNNVLRDQEGEIVFPPPRLPLIGWQSEEGGPTTENEDGSEYQHVHKTNDDYNDADDDNFSDANSSEKIGIEGGINGKSGLVSQPFMIQRFLPAAIELAAASLASKRDLNKNNNDNDNNNNNNNNYNRSVSNNNLVGVYSSNKHYREGKSRVPRVGEAYTSTKGCGMQIFFPWRAKHRLCGVKSPVRRVRSTSKF